MPLAHDTEAAYPDALALMRSLSDQVQNTNDYAELLDKDPIAMGCDYGGSLDYTPTAKGTDLGVQGLRAHRRHAAHGYRGDRHRLAGT